MKMIMAVIKPHKLEEVREALTGLGIEGVTVTEVAGFGRQKGREEIYRGNEYIVDLLPKIRLDIVVDDDRAEGVVDTVRQAANAGKIGDGKIFVTSIEQAMRIRTGETGAVAV